MKRTATFKTDGQILIGASAIAAWKNQSARCNCGSYGDDAHAVSGTCNDMPAKWLGCDNCSGQAVGRPLVYRLPSQVDKDGRAADGPSSTATGVRIGRNGRAK